MIGILLMCPRMRMQMRKVIRMMRIRRMRNNRRRIKKNKPKKNKIYSHQLNQLLHKLL